MSNRSSQLSDKPTTAPPLLAQPQPPYTVSELLHLPDADFDFLECLFPKEAKQAGIDNLRKNNFRQRQAQLSDRFLSKLVELVQFTDIGRLQAK